MEQENQTVLRDFIERFKQACYDKTIWLYTGYIFDKDLLPGQRKHIEYTTNSILNNIDVLVDGPFVDSLKDMSLRFRGSKNQRILTKYDREILINSKHI